MCLRFFCQILTIRFELFWILNKNIYMFCFKKVEFSLRNHYTFHFINYFTLLINHANIYLRIIFELMEKMGVVIWKSRFKNILIFRFTDWKNGNYWQRNVSADIDSRINVIVLMKRKWACSVMIFSSHLINIFIWCKKWLIDNLVIQKTILFNFNIFVCL